MDLEGERMPPDRRSLPARRGRLEVPCPAGGSPGSAGVSGARLPLVVAPSRVLGFVMVALLGLLSVLPAAAEEKAEYAWRPAGTQGLLARGLSCLRIHPKNPGVLWAHVHGMGPARSEDGGRTWTPALNGVPEKALPGPRSRVRISLDIQKVKTMYVVIDGQIFRSHDGSESWESVTSGALASLSWNKLNSTHLSWEVQVDGQKSVHLLVGTRNDGNHNGGLFESTNGGKSWEQIAGTDIPKSGLGNDTFLVRQDPKSEKYLTVAGRRALWRSDDRGRNFERNDPGGEGIHDYRDLSFLHTAAKLLYVADARGIWRSKDGGKKWDKKVLRAGDALAVVADPFMKKRIYAIFHDRGLEVSDDGGKKWESAGGHYAPDPDNPGDPQPGYRNAIIREVGVHPRDRKTIYLASPVSGLHISTDDGKNFAPVTPPEDAKPESVIPALVPPMALVGVHPAVKGQHLAISDQGVVYASEDRGATWQVRGRLGMAPGLLMPDSAPHTWWAAGRMLLRSEDDGATWTPHSPVGVDARADREERIVGLHRGKRGDAADAPPGVLRILLERSGVVMSSEDDGKTWSSSKAAWKPAKGDGDRPWAAGFAVDDANEAHMVIAARTTREAPSRSDENGGVFETWDGGASWKDITGALKPGKKDGVAAQRAKSNWNRAAFVGIDSISGLILYGASGRGLFARPVVDPKAKKPANPPAWIDISPKAPERPKIVVGLLTLTDDATDSRFVVQLAGLSGETAFFSIDGKTLKKMRAFRADEEKFPAVPTWTALPAPSGTVTLSSLCVDAQLPGRMLGSERNAGIGVLIYEIPGSKPKADTPKKDDDAGKKDDAQAAARLNPPEGMRAFTAGQDMAVRIWRVDKAASELQIGGHTNEVRCVALSPDEQYLVSAGTDKTVRIWKAATGEAVATVPTEAAVQALVIDDDSKFAYAALEENHQVLQIELATQKVKPFAGHTAGVLAVAASDDVNRVYSGGMDKTIRIWDTTTGAQVNEIAYGADVVGITVASDGSKLYAVGGDGSLKAFDATGAELARIEAASLGPVNSICLSPDDAMLYVAMKGGVRAIGAADLKAGVTHAAPEHTIHGLTTSAEGMWIFGGDEEGALWLWAAGEATPRWTVKAHESAIHDIAVTPDETEEPEPAAPPGDKPGDADKPGDGAKPGDADKPGGADKPGDADKPGGDAKPEGK